MKDQIDVYYAILSESATKDDHVQFQELIKLKENLLLFNQFKKIWGGGNPGDRGHVLGNSPHPGAFRRIDCPL